tara:strand:+ start:1478 stop:1678 length:201 start_codon:yes stop_codon:yes gene_type:complete
MMNTASMARLTMVGATYNVAPYINVFFESLLTQTAGLDVLEVIVVNDGSPIKPGRSRRIGPGGVRG